MQIEEIDPTCPEAAALLAAMDRDVTTRYGAPVHTVDAAGFAQSGGIFFVARIQGQAAASGGILRIGESVAEVKRLFVYPEFRRRGLARAMLAALEEAASARGYRTVRLATGDGQPEALALYESAGYRRIPCFGEYPADPHANCFEKAL